MYKSDLRRAIKTGRRALSIAERHDKEERIKIHILHRIEECGTRSLMGYLAFDGEVDLTALFDAFQVGGGLIYLPRVRDKRLGIMDVVCMPVPWRNHVVKGAYGINEPHPDLPSADPQAPQTVLVPGVAFDRSGGRIGFGGGYYDRFLPQTGAMALHIGVAFDLQLVENLLCDDHDVRVHEVCTESGCLPVSDQCLSASKGALEYDCR
jgi:5-formyltetrahydrofolate cyclo-ligase